MAAQYDYILASDFNSLFSRLESIRQIHYLGGQQTATGKSMLQESFQTTPLIAGQTRAETWNTISLVKTYLNRLSYSFYSNGVDYGADLVVPAIGDLMLISQLAGVQSAVNNVDAVVVSDGSYHASNVTGYYGSHDSGCYSYDGSYNSSNISAYDGSYDGSYNGSYRGSSYYSSNYEGGGYNGSGYASYTGNWEGGGYG